MSTAPRRLPRLQFEREGEEADPFGLDAFLSDVRAGRKKVRSQQDGEEFWEHGASQPLPLKLPCSDLLCCGRANVRLR